MTGNFKKRSITLIIDLNDDPLEKREAEKYRIQYRGLRVEDPPEQAEGLLEIFRIVEGLINKEVERGGRVYLHCTAGQQRSPACAMAYLMSNGQSKEAAIRNVKAARLGVWAGPVGVELWQSALDMWDNELYRRKT